MRDVKPSFCVIVDSSVVLSKFSFTHDGKNESALLRDVLFYFYIKHVDVI